MKSILWTLLLAAPLAAQTTNPARQIVFRIVVTTVPATTTAPPTGPVAPPTTGTTDPTDPSSGNPPTTTPIPPTGCVSFSTDGVTALNGVYANLQQTQQLYASAYAAGGIDLATYSATTNTIVGMELYTQDARDMVRVGGTADIVDQAINGVSSQVATLPTLLGNVPSLAGPLPGLVSNMQTGLANATNVVNGSCPQSTK